jgi:hypothetical protein
MRSMAFERRPGGSIFIVRHGRQYRREPGSSGRWLKRTHIGWSAVSARRARLLERAYRHRDELKKVQRFSRERVQRLPRLDDVAKQIPRRIAELVEEIFTSIARRRKVTIEIGHACNELKELVGHGRWQLFFNRTFAPCGLNLRTAERYMKLACKAAAISQIDTSSNLEPGMNKHAREMQGATAQAEAEVSAARQLAPKKRARHIYRLPLLMLDAEHGPTDELRKSSHWPHVERHIIAALREFRHKYGIATEETEIEAVA